MKTFKKQAMALALVGTLAAAPIYAKEPDRTPEHIGLGSGAAVGAVFGGPLGAILGGVFGVMVGHEQVQKAEIEKREDSYALAQQQLQQKQSELASAQQSLDALNKNMASKRLALSQAQLQLQGLQEQYASLQELVSGLRLSVYFDHNSSDVSPRYQALLDSVSQGAVKVPGLMLELQGYANKAGLDAHNQQLSELRSAEVGGLLVSKGLAENHIRKQGLGASLSATERLYAPEERRVDLMFRFEQQGLVSRD